jgi:hypothetical protein
MSRRRLILFVALVLLVAAVGLLETQRIVTGWICGEAFCQGRPTSYWQARLRLWQEQCPQLLSRIKYYSLRRALKVHMAYARASATIVVSDGNEETPDVALDTDDAVKHATALGEMLALATSPTPFLVMRPEPGVPAAELINAIGADYGISLTFRAAPTFQDRVLGWLGIRKNDDTEPAVLQGGPDAEAVLRELVDDPQVGVRVRQHLRSMRRGAEQK